MVGRQSARASSGLIWIRQTAVGASLSSAHISAKDWNPPDSADLRYRLGGRLRGQNRKPQVLLM